MTVNTDCIKAISNVSFLTTVRHCKMMVGSGNCTLFELQTRNPGNVSYIGVQWTLNAILSNYL